MAVTLDPHRYATNDESSALLARLHPELYLSNHLAHSSRASSSSTSPLTFPQVDLNLGPITSSSASHKPASIPSPSALIKYGSTTVICNITPTIVYPNAAESSFSRAPKSASAASTSRVIPSISLTPLSSPSNDFKSGAPSEYAQAITERLFSFLDAALPFDQDLLDIPTDIEDTGVESDTQATTGGWLGGNTTNVRSGKGRVRAKWCLFADCVVIGFDGALLEACFLAIIAALRQVHLPRAFYSLDENVVIASPSTQDYWSLKSKMTSLPLAFGFGIFKGVLLTTPSSFETDLLSSSIHLLLSYPLSLPSSSTSFPAQVVLSAVHSTGPLSASNVASHARREAKAVVEDEDLIAYCIQVAAVKGSDMLQLIQAKEEEMVQRRIS